MSCWALLLGFGVLMLGDGLQATLLAVRADQEQFATTMTGLIMSSFYIGFLGGSIMAPRIMTRVGHIRVFAAMAALASAAILVHAVFVDPAVWIVLRLVSGFCFAGMYVVAESWLNDRASNETRPGVADILEPEIKSPLFLAKMLFHEDVYRLIVEFFLHTLLPTQKKP